METVAKYLQQNLPGCALARLCRLALEIDGSGIQRLGGWEQQAPVADAFCLKTLRDRSPIAPATLGAAPLPWLRALDRFLYEERPQRFKNWVNDGDTRFWIVRRSSSGEGPGYRARQLGNLFCHLRYHHVFPATIGGVATRVATLPDASGMACERIQSKRSLKIVVVRFDDQVKECFTKDHACNHFHMEGVDASEERMKSAQAAIATARLHQADLLVFPELTLPPDIQDALADYLLDEAADPDTHQISFILLGSFHQQCDGQRINRARLVSHDGSTLLLIDKRFKVTFRFDDSAGEWGEAIQAAPEPFGVLPLAIGLLGAAICKDVFDGPIPQVMASIGLDWLLVPSMTNSLGPHRKATGDLCRGFGTTSIVANQPMPGGIPEGLIFPHGYIEAPKILVECTDLVHVFEIVLPASEC